MDRSRSCDQHVNVGEEARHPLVYDGVGICFSLFLSKSVSRKSVVLGCGFGMRFCQPLWPNLTRYFHSFSSSYAGSGQASRRVLNTAQCTSSSTNNILRQLLAPCDEQMIVKE